ncbi:YciI family protein [Bauldia litoralis]|uniref:Uncharacterized conserved protein n=1 Tax=Bauldia litoralis TaxID=665467 RepID=A0A1G6B6P7_9HYPH|nr:YciI family protein [Bauldia litoralis]SDB16083.1 Uncharacterized conserved protein [Bauldia litoralis]
MRFMVIVKSVETGTPPPQALMDAIGALGVEATEAGVMGEVGGLMPTAAGAEVRISGGSVSVTDGPFSEAKEVIGGFAIYDVASREEAVAWTERFMDLHRKHWPGWEGVSEIRQMYATDCRDANAPFQETQARETA